MTRLFKPDKQFLVTYTIDDCEEIQKQVFNVLEEDPDLTVVSAVVRLCYQRGWDERSFYRITIKDITKIRYSQLQIDGARKNAELHGYPEPTYQQCVEFLDWYHSHKTEIESVSEAMRIGLSGLSTNGYAQQEVEWELIFGRTS